MITRNTTCFTTPLQWQHSTFTSRPAFRNSCPPSNKRNDHSSTTMILGIPRIFAPSTRPKQEQTVRVVESPPPPLSPIDRSTTWARAHPFQAAAMISVIFVYGQRIFKKYTSSASTTTPTTTPTPTPTPTSNSSNLSSSSSSVSSSGTMKRAVPKRHETTEEALDLLGNKARKYIIVGGKGGVGKTSMSAAISTAFADRGQTTLIVSTDPAHSLSDAFNQSVTGGEPVPVSSVDNLYAQEVDPESMKKTFKMMNDLNKGKSSSLAGMEDMGLDELNSLFDTIPPGFDEAVALVEIVKYIEGDKEYSKFDRIIFDTAPTGHTLRLLALPDFLNGFFGKIISMKSKFGNVMSQFKNMFGNDVNMDNSVAEMEELKRSMNMVRELFRDEVQTEFVVATIPNMMAIAESQRLVDELNKEKIPVRHLFLNLVQPPNEDCTFCAARFKEQRQNIKYIQQELGDLKISMVQSFDKEIKGAAALRAMAAQLFPESSDGDGNVKSDDGRGTSSGGEGEQKESRTTPAAKAELVE